MALHLLHRAVVHWQAAQIQIDNERAQLVSEQRLYVAFFYVLLMMSLGS